MKQSKKLNAVVLSVAVIGLLVVTPAVGQTNDSTVTSTTTSTTQSVPSSEFNGMGDAVPVRKDAWTWYWNEKAHLDIDTENKNGFWGNDGISLCFKGIADNFVVPFWNGAMEYDFIRVGLLLIVAGMLLGFGASFFLPKKSDTK